jgi:6-phosphogluconolactonase
MESKVFPRVTFLKGIAALAGAAFAAGKWGAVPAQAKPAHMLGTVAAQGSRIFAYVGCYTTPDRNGRGSGIGVYRMDPSSGDWSFVQLLDGIPNPSFLAPDPSQRHLYSVHGGNDFRHVSSYAIDPASGELTHLNNQDCGGPNPVHLSVDPTSQTLVVADYNSGQVAALPIQADGSIGALSDLLALPGTPGPDKTQQISSHPHDVVFDPAGRFLAVPDKGLDRIFVLRVDATKAKLELNDPPSIQTRRGAGPRHIAFHPSMGYAYVINELNSTVATYGYDSSAGMLEALQVIASTPSDFTSDNTGAEIVVAPTGRFVYASNRGHESIGIFAVDQTSGILTPVDWAPTQGIQPRNFNLDPSGDFLCVGNADTDTVVTFSVDANTGMLTHTGQVIQTGTPVSIVFASM